MNATSLRELGPKILDMDVEPIAEGLVVVGDALMFISQIVAGGLMVGLCGFLVWHVVQRRKARR